MANMFCYADADDNRILLNFDHARKATFERRDGVVVKATVIFSADHMEVFAGTLAEPVFEAFNEAVKMSGWGKESEV